MENLNRNHALLVLKADWCWLV